MFKITLNNVTTEFDTLDLAMNHAKTLGVFATIKSDSYEVVGKFGVDEVRDPNYDGWISRKKR